MQYVLDTHAFLWLITDDKSLSSNDKEVIEISNNSLLVSIVSFWEIAIKVKTGKLQLNYKFEDVFKEAEKTDVKIIYLSKSDLIQLDALPLFHRDPFDRLLIAQAIANNLTIITKDTICKSYPVNILW